MLPGLDARFNPRPAGQGDATRLVDQGAAPYEFQSAPCWTGRCNVPANGAPRFPRRFNPRPAGQGDATGPAHACSSLSPVSIRALLDRAMQQRPCRPNPGLPSFNPRPAGQGDATPL